MRCGWSGGASDAATFAHTCPGLRMPGIHGLIYERCPNAALVGVLRDVACRLDAIRRTVFGQIPYRGVSSVTEHRETIETGAPPDAIEIAAREHTLNTMRSVRALQDRCSSARPTGLQRAAPESVSRRAEFP